MRFVKSGMKTLVNGGIIHGIALHVTIKPAGKAGYREVVSGSLPLVVTAHSQYVFMYSCRFDYKIALLLCSCYRIVPGVSFSCRKVFR